MAANGKEECSPLNYDTKVVTSSDLATSGCVDDGELCEVCVENATISHDVEEDLGNITASQEKLLQQFCGEIPEDIIAETNPGSVPETIGTETESETVIELKYLSPSQNIRNSTDMDDLSLGDENKSQNNANEDWFQRDTNEVLIPVKQVGDCCTFPPSSKSIFSDTFDDIMTGHYDDGSMTSYAAQSNKGTPLATTDVHRIYKTHSADPCRRRDSSRMSQYTNTSGSMEALCGQDYDDEEMPMLYSEAVSKPRSHNQWAMPVGRRISPNHPVNLSD